MGWLKWLKRITIAYLLAGLVVGFFFLLLGGFHKGQTFGLGDLKMLAFIILAWPLWVWFAVIVWLSSR